jgi:hypothetical protein
LPPKVLQRSSKAEFSIVFLKSLQALGGEDLFNSLSIASMGWVDDGKVRSMSSQMNKCTQQSVDQCFPQVWPLWQIFGIEIWFNTVFNGKEVSLPEAVHF